MAPSQSGAVSQTDICKAQPTDGERAIFLMKHLAKVKFSDTTRLRAACWHVSDQLSAFKLKIELHMDLVTSSS